MRVELIQPRHSYAPPFSVTLHGHLYFPTGLYFAAARLRAVGCDVEVHDENFGPISVQAEVVGVGVVGPPYVAAARQFALQYGTHGDGRKVLIGGQGVRGFSKHDFQSLFGSDTVNAWDEAALINSVNANVSELPPTATLSLVEVIESLPDDIFFQYFSREFSLYLSQGCRYQCTFCSAVRTSRSPLNGSINVVREEYRCPHVVCAELSGIRKRATERGIGQLNVYLSNLDLFQSPSELSQFLDALERMVSEPGIPISFRGLSTTQSFLLVHRSQPGLLSRFVHLGLRRVGFGIDGATPDVWKGIRKPQANASCLAAVQIASEVYGIIPETLMVFGHEGHDNVESLSLAVETTKRLTAEFGAVPRPHVAKGVVPGNDGWVSPNNRATVDYLIREPAAFQMLDYTCLPSWLTHRDEAFRRHVADAFLEICELPGTLTQYVKPEDPTLSAEEMAEAKVFNWKKYDI